MNVSININVNNINENVKNHNFTECNSKRESEPTFPKTVLEEAAQIHQEVMEASNKSATRLLFLRCINFFSEQL